MGIRDKRRGIRDQGSGIRGCCSDNDTASVLSSGNSNSDPRYLIPVPRPPFLISHFSFLILLSCISNPAASPVSREIPVDIAGIVHAGHTNSPEEYALLEKMGVNWLLTTFSWNSIEPSDDQWNFDFYDEYVDTAKAAGKKIIGVLGYGVPWIHNDGKSRYYIPPDKIHFFLDYVRQTAEHFRGRVDAWCIWNEPNSRFWTGSRDEFLTLARLTADAVKETDPDVILLGGAFNRGVFGLPAAYIRGLFESGAMEKVDAIAFHPYELNPVRALRLYRAFESIVADYGFAGRIWLTEVGYPTGGWYPTKVAEKRFPEYVVKTFVNFAAGGAGKIIWYQLFDPVEREKGNSEDYFGLVRSRDDYTSKGAEAFRLCAVHLAGTVYRPALPPRGELPKSLKAFYFEKPESSGGGALVLWKDGASMKIALQTSGGIMHDPVSGNASALPVQTVINIGAMPVFITSDSKIKISKGR